MRIGEAPLLSADTQTSICWPSLPLLLVPFRWKQWCRCCIWQVPGLAFHVFLCTWGPNCVLINSSLTSVCSMTELPDSLLVTSSLPRLALQDQVSQRQCHLWGNWHYREDNNLLETLETQADGWMNRCMSECVDGGINSRSEKLFVCSIWSSSRCWGGEGPRFPSSAFHYDAPWQHREWMCGRMYSLPISTPSAQSCLRSRLSSLSCFHHRQNEKETGGKGVLCLGGSGRTML